MVEGRAYQRYDLATLPGGRITGRTHTNDNLDRGYPTEEADWPVEYRDFDAMRKSTGLSHTGVSGVEVTVVLDGKRI